MGINEDVSNIIKIVAVRNTMVMYFVCFSNRLLQLMYPFERFLNKYTELVLLNAVPIILITDAKFIAKLYNPTSEESQ